MAFEGLENEALKFPAEARAEPETESISNEGALRRVQASLRGSVIRFTDPLEAVALNSDLDPEFLELIQNSRSRHARQGGLSSAEMRRRLEEELQD